MQLLASLVSLLLVLYSVRAAAVLPVEERNLAQSRVSGGNKLSMFFIVFRYRCLYFRHILMFNIQLTDHSGLRHIIK